MTDEQNRFLEAVSTSASLSEAARKANIKRKQHYQWMKTDEGYASTFPKIPRRKPLKVRSIVQEVIMKHRF
jgi:hypothetical protein